MNYFFGYDIELKNEIDWMFNLNHLFLALFVIGFVTICYFLFSSKTEKGKKVTKLFLAGILFVLEIGRIVYKYLKHIHSGGTSANFNWWWTISFQMCAIMTWLTIITLILSAFLKKGNKFLDYLYNILFGAGMIGGVLIFCYPDCMSAKLPFLHFLNIQTVSVHSLLIFIPIYFVKTGDLKVEFKNVWKAIVGYGYVGAVSLCMSLISGNNFAFALDFGLFDLGVEFPFHLPIVMLILFVLDLLVYGIFELVRLIKNRKNKVEKTNEKKFSLNKNIYIANIITAVVFGIVIILATASLIGKSEKTLLGLFEFVGLAYMIIMLVVAELTYKKNLNYQNYEIKKSKAITIIVLMTIFNLPVGLMYLIGYLKTLNYDFSKN